MHLAKFAKFAKFYQVNQIAKLEGEANGEGAIFAGVHTTTVGRPGCHRGDPGGLEVGMPTSDERETFEHYMGHIQSDWDAWLCRSVCPNCIARESCRRRRDVIVQKTGFRIERPEWATDGI